MTVTMKLSGFREMEQALEELEKLATRRAVARRALIKSAQPMAEIMRTLAPDDPATSGDDLKASIGVGTKLAPRQARSHRRMFANDRAAVEVFVGAGTVPQAHLQEFGTQNHGMQPFARPAWDQDKEALLRRLGEEMWTEIEKSVARARRKAAQQAASG